MFYYDVLFDNPSGLWPLDYSAGSVFTDVSGLNNDAVSSAIINLLKDPNFSTPTSPAATVVTRQNMTYNPRAEVASGTNIVRQNLVLNPVSQNDAAGYGTSAESNGTITVARQTAQPGLPFGLTTTTRATWTAASTTGNGGLLYGSTALPGFTAGNTYSFYVFGKVSKLIGMVIEAQWFTAGDVYVSSHVSATYNYAANSGGGYQINGVVAPATAAKVRIYLKAATAGANWAIGDWVEMTMVQAEETTVTLSTGGTSLNGTFCGGWSAGTFGADYTYAWAGTAHASVSEMRAPAPTGPAAVNSASLSRSTDRAVTGAYSYRIMCSTRAAGAGLQFPAFTGLIVGRKYTWAAKVWIPSSYSGGQVRTWESTALLDYGGTNQTSLKDQWVQLYGTFTATATSHQCGILSAAPSVRGDDMFYVTDCLFEEYDTVKPYFDGATKNILTSTDFLNVNWQKPFNNFTITPKDNGWHRMTLDPASASTYLWRGGLQLSEKFTNSAYTYAIEARNIGTEAVTVSLDLHDLTVSNHTINPGETKTISTTSTYAGAAAFFADLALNAGVGSSNAILEFRYPRVFLGQDDLGWDYTYSFLGAAHITQSQQKAPEMQYWRHSGSTPGSSHISTEWSLDGGTSIKVNGSGNAQYYRAYVPPADQIAVSPGETIGVRGTVKAVEAQASIFIKLVFFTSGDVLVADNSTVGTGPMTAGQVKTISGSNVAPATAAKCRVELMSTEPVGARKSFYVDKVIATKGAVPTEYFDGYSANGAWSGTPNASASMSSTFQFVEPVIAGGMNAVRINQPDTMAFPFYQGLFAGKENRSASIEFWTKAESDLGQLDINRGITITGTDIEWDLGGTNTLLAENVIDPGIGQHLVFIYTPGNMSIYVDTFLAASTIVTDPDFSALTDPNIIFSAGNASTQINIDTVAFYNYALASDRILRHNMNSTAWIPAQNISGGNNTIRFEFDDVHLADSIRIESDYRGLTNNAEIRDNQINQVWDGDDYPTSVYTELIQFDDQMTGTATNARVDWEVDGDASRVTVESSANGTSWAPVVNHGMTTNLTGPVVNEDFFIRVTISAGAEPVAVWGLTTTLYRGFVYTSSDTGVIATATGGDVTTGYFEANPTQFKNNEGVKLNNGAALVVSTHTEFGTVGAIELLVKPITNATATIYAKGAASIAKSGGALVWTGFDRVIVDGVEVENGVDSGPPVGVGWKHIVATFTTPSTGVSYIGTTTTLTSPMNPRVGYFVMHKKKLTTAQAQAIYKTYVGAPALTIVDVDTIQIGEHGYGTTNEPVKLYAFDWSISESGA